MKGFLRTDINYDKSWFISEANKKYPNLPFDYSQIEYLTIRKDITIQCLLHGPFTVQPYGFLRQQNYCRGCRSALNAIIVDNELEALNSPYKLMHETFISKSVNALYINKITGQKLNSIFNKIAERSSVKKNQKREREKEIAHKKHLEKLNDDWEYLIKHAPGNFKMEYLNFKGLNKISIIQCLKHSKDFKDKSKFLLKPGSKKYFGCNDCKKEIRKNNIIKFKLEKKERQLKLFADFKNSTEFDNVLDLSKITLHKNNNHKNFNNTYTVKDIRCIKHNLYFSKSVNKLQSKYLLCATCSRQSFLDDYRKQVKNKFESIAKNNVFLQDLSVKKFVNDKINNGVELECNKHGSFILEDTSFYRILNNKNKTNFYTCVKCNLEHYSVAVLYPDLILDYDKKNTIPLSSITAGNSSVINWCCQTCAHKWSSTINAKLNLAFGCPKCGTGSTSKIERMIYYSLKSIFKKTINDHRIKIKNKKYRVDIILNGLKPKLIIEYDGSYYHKNKTVKDKEKTQKLLNVGYDVIRIRENFLKKIFKTDIKYQYYHITHKLFSKNYTQLIYDILNYILKNYTVNKTIELEINNALKYTYSEKDFPKNMFFNPKLKNSIYIKYPFILNQWDYKNNIIPPERVSATAGKSLWWICGKCSNSYQRTIFTMVKYYSNNKIACQCSNVPKNKKINSPVGPYQNGKTVILNNNLYTLKINQKRILTNLQHVLRRIYKAYTILDLKYNHITGELNFKPSIKKMKKGKNNIYVYPEIKINTWLNSNGDIEFIKH